MPKVELELELEQVVKILERLTPAELETLQLSLNPELTGELKKSREKGKTELKQRKTLSKEELFSD